MRVSSWLLPLAAFLAPTRYRPTPRRRIFRPRVEGLEDRTVPSVTISEFPLPAASSIPAYIHAGPDGNVWFQQEGAFRGKVLGRITPTGQITELGLGVPEDVARFAFGTDGNIWVGGTTHLSEVNTQGTLLRDYVLPSATNSSTIFLVVGADGSVWCAEYSASVIARVTPAGQVTEFPIPFPAAEIINGPDGNFWFEGTYQHAIGRITPAGVVGGV
jgi:virginiamycin B lyase